jgi:glycosyltransferase involved in cell wall biosynthesis
VKLSLISTVSGAANGGTAAYVRCLGNQMIQAGHHVSGVNRLHLANDKGLDYAASDAGPGGMGERFLFDGWESCAVAPSKVVAPSLRLLPHFMSRPRIDRISDGLFGAAYNKAVERQVPIDIEVIHFVGSGWELLGFSALRVARRRGAIFTVTPFVHPGNWADSVLDIRFYNCADAVFVCSELEKTYLIEKGVSPSRLRITPMAPAGILPADAQRFRHRHRLGQRPLILFLARKQRYKGYHVLREAMAKVIAAVPDVCLVAAGPDVGSPYPPISEGHFLDLGELTPSSDDAQHKVDALAACDVFCMPSTAEAFGLVYVEAWHFGKPVIGGIAPALQELIIDGVNGYRVEQDAAQVAHRLIQLLRDDGLRRRMGEEGHRIQQEKYTWKSVLKRHMQVWEELRNAPSNHL